MISSKVLQLRFGYTVDEAGFIINIPSIISAIFNPIAGILIDKYGENHRFHLIVGGSLLLCLGEAFLILIPDCEKCAMPILPTIILGLSYTLLCVVLYVQISMTVDPKFINTAYGIAAVFINTVGTLYPAVLGYI